MKVAYFLGALNRGGTETLIYDLCRNHTQMPYDMVCLYRHEGNMSEVFHSSGAPMLRIPKKGSILRYIFAIRHTLQREHVTIVHSQTPSNTLLLAFALLGSKIKVITTFHGHLFANASWWQRQIVYRASRQILCVSRYQKSVYEHRWKLPENNKLQVVYNGIDFSKIDSVEPIAENKASGVKSQESRIRLAMVGNFVSGRSPQVVVKAIHRLQQMSNDHPFDFYFIGGRVISEPWCYDDCVKYCEEHQLNNVHFLGSRGDVPELLKTMDGFVYSTVHDTFGIAVIEAIAAGLPVVVNDWRVMTEVCELGLPESNAAIRFFKTEDVNDCTQKIKALLAAIYGDRQYLSANCAQAAEAVKHKYSIQSHIENLLTIYEKTNI